MNTNSTYTKLALVIVSFACFTGALAGEPGPSPKILRLLSDGSVTVSFEGKTVPVKQGERIGNWTLMAAVKSPAGKQLAVFEDFTDFKGRMVFAGSDGNGR